MSVEGAELCRCLTAQFSEALSSLRIILICFESTDGRGCFSHDFFFFFFFLPLVPVPLFPMMMMMIIIIDLSRRRLSRSSRQIVGWSVCDSSGFVRSVFFSVCESELDSEKTTERHQQAAAAAAVTLFLPTFVLS